VKSITARDFNQDVSQAKRAARLGPVIITDRGRPTHVLVSIEAYRQLTGGGQTIVELLATPDGDGPLELPTRPALWRD
jgi:prevent-host-death family protein